MLKKSMKNTSKFILLILAIALTSCGAMGTRTLYKAEINLNKPTKIGFSQVANEDIMEKIVKGSTKIYDSTMTNQLATQNIKSNKIIVENYDGFESINETKIKSICTDNQLDGMILTQLKFLNVKYSSMFIPIGVSEDTEVEMQYYDANGHLLLHTKHNTHMGNSYWDFPSADKTVTDGTKGALGRIIKEIAK
ncbi:MAG: hypothetical protein CMC55_02780 [Flavobacteriaceae bacterium]|nr:hypothetical protein [Flavobacteriaceae bacterium]|tara:strand:- start:269 stop:847 length:579 start_codon:yes stop_codon:yes gene_type:complete